MKQCFDTFLGQMPVIAICRGITPQEVTAVCDALYAAGILLLEIPLNSPEAFASIKIAAEYCNGRQLVGAGTVLSPEDVRLAGQAGGSFVISPNADEEVIRETKACGMLSIPGFFTATEAFAALKSGADYLKLFPAVLGPGYIKDLQAVIKVPILAFGGVDQDNIAGFVRVCAGVGIGNALYKPGKNPAEIAADAAMLVQNIR